MSASGTTGGVSTLDKEPSWPEAPVSSPSAWSGSDGGESWSDALPPTPAAKSFPSLDPASEASAGWGGGGSWGEDDAKSGEAAWNGSPAPSPVPASPASLAGSGWLDGSDSESKDTWGGPPSSLSSSSLPQSRGLAGSDGDDGWGGGSSAGLGSKPTSGGLASSGSDGWGAGSSVPSSLSPRDDWGAGVSASSGLGASVSSVGTGGGWLGDADEPALGGGRAVESAGSSAGWLSGGSRETHSESSDGWLGGDEPTRAPSMTEMVDHAIGVEEADDFVDESWVDEEINSDFEEFETPEYTPPSPEVGSAFLKMLLVAALVLLVGGGVMFMGKEEKTPEQIKAEERAKELQFARDSVVAGNQYLKEGKPLLAVGPLTAAMTSLKTTGAPQDEILSAKADLARALMKAQEYEKAYDQWVGLVKGPEKYRKEAVAGRDDASRLLRAQATSELADAAKYYQMGESSSVLQAGEKALKIFEKHNGTASQKGKALGVIGRGYLNGKEYGKAKDYLKKARSLNPGGGYDADLRELASRTAPVDYYDGGSYSGGYSAPQPVAQPQTVRVDASIDAGANYAKSTRTYAPRTSSSSQASAPAQTAPVQAAPARRAVQPAPAPRRSAPRSNSGGRKGSKGVLPGYDS